RQSPFFFVPKTSDPFLRDVNLSEQSRKDSAIHDGVIPGVFVIEKVARLLVLPSMSIPEDVKFARTNVQRLRTPHPVAAAALFGDLKISFSSYD
ncbi:Uncharacterized protein APZ42_009059, partial [Daphnia magna]